jgi:hypothetical protein
LENPFEDSSQNQGKIMTFENKTGQDFIWQASYLAHILDSIQAGINILDKDMNILAANSWHLEKVIEQLKR